MEYVSFLGTTYILLLTLLVIISGVNFRKGLLLLNLVGWGILLMLFAKHTIDYPRPIAVDSTLESFNREITKVDYSNLQPTGFFEGFSDELLVIIRKSEIGRQGFPSGHVMIITAMWIGMALLFKKRWLWIISISLVVLTIISRMYLGVHYLGDVVGGLLFGILVVLVFNELFKKLNLFDSLELDRNRVVFLLSPLVLFLFYSVVPGFQTGTFIGFNLAFLLILKFWGELEISSSAVKRVLNTLLFIVLFFASYVLARLLPLGETGLVSILGFTTINFVVVLLFFYLGKMFKFYIIPENEKIS